MELGAVLSLRDKMSSNMEKASGSVNKMTERVEKTNSVMKRMGSIGKIAFKAVAAAALAALMAFGGFAKESLDTFVTFDDQLRNVAATLGSNLSTAEGQAEFRALSDAAKEASRTTQFSAIEATGGLDALAAAGYEANDAISALPKVLKLAAAGGLDVATATTYATQTMSALQEPVENMESLFNQWAKAGAATNAGVKDLGEAFLTLGATGKNAGLDIADTNTALGILANNGMLGAQGGTALRNVLLSLSAPTTAASKTLKKLGVNVADSTGAIRPFNDVLVDLNSSMASMSQEQRLQTMSQIFNKNDLKAVSALLASAGDEFSNIKSVILDSDGAMDQMAETMTGGLGGSIQKLKNGFEGLKIAFGEQLAPVVGQGVDLITGYINKLSSGMEGGVSGVLAAFNEIVGDIVSHLAKALPGILSFGAELIVTLVQGIAQSLPTVARAAVNIGLSLLDTLFGMIPMLVEAGFDIIVGLYEGIAEALPTLIPTAIQAIIQFVQALIQNAPKVLQAGISMVGALIDGVLAAIPVLLEEAPRLFAEFLQALFNGMDTLLAAGLRMVQSIISGIASNLPLLVQSALGMVNSLVQGLIENLPLLVESALQIIMAVAMGLIENLPLIIQSAISLVLSLIQGIVSMLPVLVKAALQLVLGIAMGIINNLPVIIESAIQIIMALVMGLVQAIPQLIAALPVIIMAIIETILNTNWLEVGAQIIVGIIKGIISMITGIFDAVSQLVSGVVGFFKKLLGIGGDDGAQATKDIGNATGQGFKAGMEESAGDVAAASESIADSTYAGLMPDTSQIAGLGAEVPAAYAEGMNSGAGEAINAANFLSDSIEQAPMPEVNVNFSEVDMAAIQGAIPILNEFKAVGTDVFNSMTTTVGSFVALIQGLNLFDSGRDVIKGFIDGIESMESRLLETARRLASSVANTINKVLDIHSPSRVLEGTGVNATEGLIQGVEKPRSKLEYASKRLGWSLVRGAEEGSAKPYDYAGLDVARASGGNAGTSVTNNYGNGGGRVVHVKIDKVIENVEVHDEADIEKITDAVIDTLATAVGEVDGNMGYEEEAV